MIDYTILYKEPLPPAGSDWQESWDLFISGYSLDDRVREVFAKVDAGEKWWLIHREYGFQPQELPDDGEIFAHDSADEAVYCQSFIHVRGPIKPATRVCIDISGLMRPHLLFLLRYLTATGHESFDVLYSEPATYTRGASTQFARGDAPVRQVAGYEGVHDPDTDEDLVVIGCGYDPESIARAAYSKDHARKLQMFGLPSLQPDMYQQSRLRAKEAEEALGASAETEILVAPANDPFVTAAVVQETVDSFRALGRLNNLYLCPVGSKAQALGFGLYYVTECLGKPVSMIYPFAQSYEKKTATGLKQVWRYTIEKLP